MEAIRLRYEVDADDLSRAGEASGEMKMTLRRLGIPNEIIRRAAICMYESEINMVIHADGGVAEVTVTLEDITITLTDTGPGIPDLEKAMSEGWTTAGETARGLGFGAGMGLPNMKRHADEMRVDTRVGEGTTVTMVIHL